MVPLGPQISDSLLFRSDRNLNFEKLIMCLATNFEFLDPGLEARERRPVPEFSLSSEVIGDPKINRRRLVALI